MARRKKAGGFERILVPTDFSKASEDAADYAAMIARQYGSRLYVVHVVDVTGEAAGFYMPHISYDKLDAEMKKGAEEMLGKFTARVFKGVKDLDARVIVGEPYKEILKLAKNEGVDLIVMGTYGMAGLDRFLFGSTTERVLRKSPCPVLAVPPER